MNILNILISPLNWGIGHATRLVPIIKFLQKEHNLTIAADGNALHFLKNEFPNLNLIEAPFLEIKYTTKKSLMPLKVLFLLPKLLIFYLKNKIWIKKYIKNNQTDVIISDNRFGFFSKKVYSIFITHQIEIAIPKRLKVFEKIVFWINRSNIEKFDECWIPDKEGEISGKLSDSKNIKIVTKEIGTLSRFEKKTDEGSYEKFDVLVLISGPEPQRSIFENLIFEGLLRTKYKVLILSGKPQKLTENIKENIKIKNHLPTNTLNYYLQNTDLVIARAGYSTIMDLVALQNTAILVPTPGQTEQEYLADYLHNKNMFLKAEQEKLNIIENLKELSKKREKLVENIRSLNIKNNFATSFDENIILNKCKKQ